LGWTKAARAARLHPLSRLHAMHSAVNALAQRDLKLANALTARALSRSTGQGTKIQSQADEN
jgi:hypothetical protein